MKNLDIEAFIAVSIVVILLVLITLSHVTSAYENNKIQDLIEKGVKPVEAACVVKNGHYCINLTGYYPK